MQADLPQGTITKRSPSVPEDSPPKNPETPMLEVIDEEDYISLEEDNVRIYLASREILPGVEIDVKTFRIFLGGNKEKYLEFREPETGECLESIKTNREKARQAVKKGKSAEEGEEEALLDFICTLSIGEIPATRSLFKSLPVYYMYRIVRTIDYISEAKGTKLG